MKKKILMVCLILSILTLTACFSKKRQNDSTNDMNSMTEENNTIEELPETVEEVIQEIPANYVNPYPLNNITYIGDNKLVIKDESSKDQSLQFFIMKLKEAVINKDTNSLLNMVSDDIDSSKEGFIKTWQLESNPESSEIWSVFENLFPWGGMLAYDDQYVIPYMALNIDQESPSGVIIGDYVNVRKGPSIEADVLEQLDYDYIDITKSTNESYTIDGINYKWLEIITPSGNTGYVVSKFVYSPYDFRIVITKKENNWKVTSFVAID